MRIKNSLKNALFGIILQGTMMALGFICRKVFLINLDEEFLGLNGLLSNVLSLLSIAELGISTSIIYSLYTPLVENDQQLIRKLMNFYKKCYRIIAGFMFTLGMMLLPFIPDIIGQTTLKADIIQTTYVLFLLMNVSTYFFSYKRSIVYADQKSYKIMYLDILFKLISFVVSIMCLILFKNYLVYLVGMMLTGILNNYIVSQYVDKLYPFLTFTKLKLGSDEIKPIIANTKNIFIHKLTGIVISSTDNIIISYFLGIIQVGIYSNYSLIITSLQGVVSKILDSCQASIGNLLVVETKEKIEETLLNITFLSFLLTSVCTVSLFCLTNDFISLWLGKKYLLSTPVVAICAINFFTSNIKNPLNQFINVSGLFKEDRNNAIIGATLNISLSLAFVQPYGIVGIFLGIYLASFFTLFLKANFFYEKYFNKSSKSLLLKLILFYIIVYFEMALCYYLCILIYVQNLMVLLLLKLVVCIIFPSILNFLIFYNTKELKYLTGLSVTLGINYLRKVS